MIKKYIAFIYLVFINYNLSAQLIPINDKSDYPFWLYLPNDSVLNSKPPVLIFLHGKSLSGTNLELIKRYGVITEIIKGRTIHAIVIAPQVKVGSSWDPDKILSVLNYVQQNYSTDSARVYVVGMSLGGYGTLHFAGKYPDKIAAAVALCGGGKEEDGCNLSTIPLWIQHGEKDEKVPISESEKIVKAIQKCNGGKYLTYKVYQNYGHSELARVFSSDELYVWLFQQSKKIRIENK